MNKFDKKTLGDIRKDISDALELIAKKRGIDSLKIGSISFSDNKFTTRVTGVSSKADEVTNLPPNLSKLLNTEFVYRSDKYLVIDIKPRSPKFPIIAQNTATKSKFKFPMSILNK